MTNKRKQKILKTTQALLKDAMSVFIDDYQKGHIRDDGASCKKIYIMLDSARHHLNIAIKSGEKESSK